MNASNAAADVRSSTENTLPLASMVANKTIQYDVLHPAGHVFNLADSTLSNLAGDRPVFIVVDASLVPAYGDAIERYAKRRLLNLGSLTVSGHESDKTLASVVAVCGAALEAGVPRNGIFVAIGGGVVLDTVGFAASIYRRGISFIRIPTTLIGMIDVGVGIKQGVNFGEKKNFLGSFYAPLGTINDASFLHELPRRHLACGLAEALKMGLICDDQLFNLIERHGATLLQSGFRSPERAGTEIIERAELSMMAQLESNIYEHDLRRLVDFGHTFSPVIETTSNYEVRHGEAVALDMLLSTALAAGRSLCDQELVPRLLKLYSRIGMPTTHPSMSPLRMEGALSLARAHRSGSLNLVVPTTIGAGTFLQNVSHDEIAAALDTLIDARSAA